jgi:hypothetical protein
LGKFVQSGGVVSVEGETLKVQPFADADAADVVTFDLTNPTDYKFFAELSAVQHLFSALKSGVFNGMVTDNHPDLFTLTLVGLKSLLEVDGAESPKAKIAARMLDGAVGQILRQFEQLYRNDFSAQVLLMGSRPSVEGTLKKDVTDVVADNAHPQFSVDASFPHIYVEETMGDDAMKSLCSQVHDSASKHGMKAECYSRTSFVQSKASLKAGNSTVTTDDVISFQINLWVSFSLFLVLLGGLYPLMYMDVTKGTYSSFLFAKKYV